MATLYATPDDLKQIYEEADLIEASNLNDADAETINEEKLMAACVAATNIINGYLIERYSLPMDLESLPELAGALRTHGAALARQRLGGVTKEVEDDAKAAYNWLERFTKKSSSTSSSGSSSDNSASPLDTIVVPSIDYGAGRQVWTESTIRNLDL